MNYKKEFNKFVDSLVKEKKITKDEATNLKELAWGYAYQEWRKGAQEGFADKFGQRNINV